MKKRKNYTKFVVILIFCVLIFALLSSCDLLRGDNANNQSDGEKDPAAEEHIHDFKPGYDIESHFVGCTCGEKINTEAHSFDWVIDSEASYLVSGYKHKECQACGYIAEENTTFSEDKNEDGTLKLSDELILDLAIELKDSIASINPIIRSIGGLVGQAKGGAKVPLLINLSNERVYYVCAYFNPEHTIEEELSCYCCILKYSWVGFEKAEDITENHDGKTFIAAYQINLSDSCINIMTNEDAGVVEHFIHYTPTFVDGENVAEKIVTDTILLYFTEYYSKHMYCCTEKKIHKYSQLDLFEIDGELYVGEYRSLYSIDENGHRYDSVNIEQYYGIYYEDLMKIAIFDARPITNTNGSIKTYYYGIFKLADFIDLLRNN